jgi:hypothetical protein
MGPSLTLWGRTHQARFSEDRFQVFARTLARFRYAGLAGVGLFQPPLRRRGRHPQLLTLDARWCRSTPSKRPAPE